MKKLRLFFLPLLLLGLQAIAAPVTGIDGWVVDAQNGDTLPFVQMLFDGSTISPLPEHSTFVLWSKWEELGVSWSLVGLSRLLSLGGFCKM